MALSTHISYFIMAVTKCLVKSNLGKEYFFLTYGLRAWSITAEEVRGQERGTTGHTLSAVSKEEK